MGITDFFSDLYDRFGFTEAHADAPQENEGDSKEGEGEKEEGGDEGGAEEGDDEGGEGGEEEEEEEEEPVDPKPQLEDGKCATVFPKTA